MKYLKDIIFIIIIIMLIILLLITHLDDNFNILTSGDWINLIIGLITAASTITIGYETIKISAFPFTKKIEIYHFLDCKENNIDFTAYIELTNVGFCPIALKSIELYDSKYLVEAIYFSRTITIKSNSKKTIKLHFKVTNNFKHTKNKKIIVTDVSGKKFVYKFQNYAVG